MAKTTYVAAVVVAVLAAGFVFLLASSSRPAEASASLIETNTPLAAQVVAPAPNAQVPAAGDTRTLAVSIEGMTCGSCVARIKSVVSALPGVASVDVSLQTDSGTIVYDSKVVTKQQIIDKITAAGYPSAEISDSSGGQAAASGAATQAVTGSSCGGGGCGCGCGG
jgi:copper chaperone CopZ